MHSLTSSHGAFWRLLDTIGVALAKLNQIQFEAPWKAGRRSRG